MDEVTESPKIFKCEKCKEKLIQCNMCGRRYICLTCKVFYCGYPPGAPANSKPYKWRGYTGDGGDVFCQSDCMSSDTDSSDSFVFE